MNDHDQEQTMETLKKGKCLRKVNCCYVSYFPPSVHFIIDIQTALRSVEDEEQEDRQIRDIESGQNFPDTISARQFKVTLDFAILSLPGFVRLLCIRIICFNPLFLAT